MSEVLAYTPETVRGSSGHDPLRIPVVREVEDPSCERLVLLGVAVGELGQERGCGDPNADRDACPSEHLGPEGMGVLLGEVARELKKSLIN